LCKISGPEMRWQKAMRLSGGVNGGGGGKQVGKRRRSYEKSIYIGPILKGTRKGRRKQGQRIHLRKHGPYQDVNKGPTESLSETQGASNNFLRSRRHKGWAKGTALLVWRGRFSNRWFQPIRDSTDRSRAGDRKLTKYWLFQRTT